MLANKNLDNKDLDNKKLDNKKRSLPSKLLKPTQLLKPIVTNPIKRSKIVYGMLDTMAGGYRAATKIDAWKNPNREILPKYIQAFCRKMAQSFGIEVVAVEPIPTTHALWASNHISWMDIPVVGSVSPAFFLSKAEVATMPVFGPLAKVCGSLFIQRGSGDANSMATQMAEFLRKGYSIIFFPEATTTDGKKIKKIYGKLLQSAMDANVPIQPMVICYVNSKGTLDDKVPYCGDMSLKDSLLQVMDSDPVTAYVLPLAPLLPEGKTRDELTELLQQQLQQGLEDLHHRVLKRVPA